MKRVMNWFRTSIQRRLFLYFTVLVVPALILLGVTFYRIASLNMARNIDQYSEQILAQAILHLELYLKDYGQDTLAALGDEFVTDFLSEK
ncbi:MAG: hypothetical protein GX493_13480 [Firmicutes bacterium]|nr:hypothetical protein [Bacillota bacterium]